MVGAVICDRDICQRTKCFELEPAVFCSCLCCVPCRLPLLHQRAHACRRHVRVSLPSQPPTCLGAQPPSDPTRGARLLLLPARWCFRRALPTDSSPDPSKTPAGCFDPHQLQRRARLHDQVDEPLHKSFAPSVCHRLRPLSCRPACRWRCSRGTRGTEPPLYQFANFLRLNPGQS